MAKIIDPDVKVYETTFSIVVRGTIAVLGRSPHDARSNVTKKDFEEILDLQPDALSVDEGWLQLDSNDAVEVSYAEPTIVDDYPVKDHPMFDEAEHTVDDPNVGMQEQAAELNRGPLRS